MDLDDDGFITRDEFNGTFSIFEVLDADNDGRITRGEYYAAFDKLDQDKSGFITRWEFGSSSAAPFDLLDKDKDEKLTRQEFEAGFDLFDWDGDGYITKPEFNGFGVKAEFSTEVAPELKGYLERAQVAIREVCLTRGQSGGARYKLSPYNGWAALRDRKI